MKGDQGDLRLVQKISIFEMLSNQSSPAACTEVLLDKLARRLFRSKNSYIQAQLLTHLLGY